MTGRRCVMRMLTSDCKAAEPIEATPALMIRSMNAILFSGVHPSTCAQSIPPTPGDEVEGILGESVVILRAFLLGVEGGLKREGRLDEVGAAGEGVSAGLKDYWGSRQPKCLGQEWDEDHHEWWVRPDGDLKI